MVRLSKIYTKIGDGGQTMLGDGATVPKQSLRVAAYGTVDEANATVGVVLARIGSKGDPDHPFRDELVRVQNDLFDLGADLCVPVKSAQDDGKLRVSDGQVSRLEAAIDELNKRLKPLDSFVLPGGSEVAAGLHLARTVVRRAERLVAELIEQEPERTNGRVLVYLNRLSDVLFVMARVANADGSSDVLWKPGANR